ncbi:MAG: thioredoxin family protein [Candidatus Bathyarchaeota archaeon]|nr:thioredoxin family protein [Candidatus Bathyarchaeota archaeon]
MQTVLEINEDDWNKEILESPYLTVVDFWHEGCLWCKKLEPIFKEVAEEYKSKAKFASFNVLASSENQSIAIEYGIMGVPTIGFFCAKRPVEIVVGFQQKERLKQLVDEVVANHKECLEKSTQIKIS